MYPGAPLPPWEKDGGQRRGWSHRGSSQDAVSRAESQALGLEGSHTESLLALRRHSHRLSLPSDSNAGPRELCSQFQVCFLLGEVPSKRQSGSS